MYREDLSYSKKNSCNITALLQLFFVSTKYGNGTVKTFPDSLNDKLHLGGGGGGAFYVIFYHTFSVNETGLMTPYYILIYRFKVPNHTHIWQLQTHNIVACWRFFLGCQHTNISYGFRLQLCFTTRYVLKICHACCVKQIKVTFTHTITIVAIVNFL